MVKLLFKFIIKFCLRRVLAGGGGLTTRTSLTTRTAQVSAVLSVCLNVVTHVTIDFRFGTGSLGATLKRFRKARWVAITDSRFEK